MGRQQVAGGVTGEGGGRGKLERSRLAEAVEAHLSERGGATRPKALHAVATDSCHLNSTTRTQKGCVGCRT